MRTNAFKISSNLILLLYSIFLSACKNTTEPNQEIKLKIEEGYYHKVGESSDNIKYSVEFNYLVTGIECSVNGYLIKWDENNTSRAIWYLSQKLIPGKIYSISDTFRLSSELKSGPEVRMQGYLDDNSERDERLAAQCTLITK